MEISAVWLGAKGSRRCRANVASKGVFDPNEPEELTSSSGSDSDPFAFVPSCERGKAIPASKKNGDSKIDKILAQERTYRKMDKAEINHVPKLPELHRCIGSSCKNNTMPCMKTDEEYIKLNHEQVSAWS